jgi:hypothetical protein
MRGDDDDDDDDDDDARGERVVMIDIPPWSRTSRSFFCVLVLFSTCGRERIRRPDQSYYCTRPKTRHYMHTFTLMPSPRLTIQGQSVSYIRTRRIPIIPHLQHSHVVKCLQCCASGGRGRPVPKPPEPRECLLASSYYDDANSCDFVHFYLPAVPCGGFKRLADRGRDPVGVLASQLQSMSRRVDRGGGIIRTDHGADVSILSLGHRQRRHHEDTRSALPAKRIGSPRQ